jgi:GLPGLI family protein
MKLIYTLLFALVTTALSAQNREGSITYTLTISVPGNDKAAEMMNGSTMTLFYKDGSTRSEVNMGGMMTMATISTANSDKVLMLMDVPMANMKYATLTSVEEAEKSPMAQKPNFKISYENETKEILGYTCKKAILTTDTGAQSVFWYTTDILAHTSGQTYLNFGLGGIPLEYEVVQQGMLIQFTATDLQKSIDESKVSSLFSMEIPAGYTLKSINELMPIGGGGPR